MISRILVATDGSKSAIRSAEYAVDLAKQVNASIVLLSIIDKSAFVPQSIPAPKTPTRIIQPLEDYMRQAAEGYLGDAERLCVKNEIKSKKVIRSGHPVEEIIKEAKKSKVDLIMVGSHGKSALKAALIGSVTFGLINRKEKIPVLVIKG